MFQLENDDIRGNNPFAEAILSFIDELKDTEDRKSIFYKEVIQVACRLYLNKDDSHQSLLSATGLSDFMSDLQVQHKSKSGIRKTFTFVQPLVEGLMQYTSAVDVMVQADPTVSALIYGGAKLVLQLANEYTNYFEQITVMTEEIGVQLRCFHIYNSEFGTDKYLSGILCNSYRDILLFWRDASKILSQKGKRFFTGGLLSPFRERYGKFKAKLDKNVKSVERMTQALHIQAQGNLSRTQTLQVREIAKSIERGSSPRPPDYSDSDTVTQHDEIRKWVVGGRVSRIDPKPDLERHLSSRHPQTAEWIFENTVLKSWQLRGETTGLWINAAPGSGKSVLAASLVDRLQQSSDKAQAKVIYFFCRFDDPEKSKAISALRSLSMQALKLLKYIPEELYELYQDECTAQDCYITTVEIAEKVLGYLLKRIDYATVVIDGLDECCEPALIDSLIRLRNQKGLGITKWLFTSRNDAVVRKKFENSNWDTLTVPSKIVEADIRRFLEDNSDLICGNCDQLDRIVTSSEGNFLMMRLMIDPFRNEELTCSEEFDRALYSFQPELGRCWFRSLQRLLERSEQIQELAQLIFMVVILSEQPMKFDELVDLLSVKIGEEPSRLRRRSRSIILSACSPFIEIDYEQDFVNPILRLVHKSVGDLLTQDPKDITFVTEDCYKFFVDFHEGNTAIGQRCISYLSYKRYEDFTDLSQADSVEHSLLKYASMFWYKHINDGVKSKGAFETVRDFLKSPNFWTCCRVQAKYSPHVFAKLTHQGSTFVMASPDPSDAPDKAYYADALPSWLEDYDNEGDDLVWGYHMLVREWGEVMLTHPDQTQHYFAKILGERGFWYIDDNKISPVQVKLLRSSTYCSDTLEENRSAVLKGTTVWRTEILHKEDKKAAEIQEDPKYISDRIRKTPGSWQFHLAATVSKTHEVATIYRYKSQSNNLKAAQDSDEDNSEDEDKKKDLVHEPSIFFLSVNNGKDKIKWYHHFTKSGILQKSAPIFVSGTPWLLWAQDDVSIFALDTTSWNSDIIKMPALKVDEEYVLLSQDLYFSPSSSQLNCASVYASRTNNKAKIIRSIFELSLSDLCATAVKSPPTLISSQEATWRRTSISLDVPVSYFWYSSTLYVALSYPCTKILRFPPSGTAQIYKTTHFNIPSSAYSRQLRFSIESSDPSSTIGDKKLKASFTLEALPSCHLEAVMFSFEMDEEKGWEEYDAEKEEKLDGQGLWSRNWWKGGYASKNMAFSVPIRSGLDWRRSVYVTCW